MDETALGYNATTKEEAEAVAHKGTTYDEVTDCGVAVVRD